MVTQAVYRGGAICHHAFGIKLHIVSHYSLHKPAFYPVSLLLKTSCRAKKVMKIYSSGAKQTLWQVTGKSYLTYFLPKTMKRSPSALFGHTASQMPYTVKNVDTKDSSKYIHMDIFT